MSTMTAAKNSTIVRNSMLLALRIKFALGSWLRPKATLRRAYALFCTPLPSSRRRALNADAGDAAVSRFTLGNEELRLYRWGDPLAEPYVLLAHGWSSHALRFSAWIRPLRAAGFSVIAFDQIGHGLSSGRRATLPGFADVLTHVGKHYGRAAAVIGHSLGGAASMLALSAGLEADRAVLIAPAADPLDAARRFARFVGLADHLSSHLFDAYESGHPLRVSTLQAHLKVPAIGRPALIVHDLGDREVPWSEGERYARHWPDARMVTTTGLGHHRIVDDAGVIDASIRFLRGNAVGDRIVSSPNLPYGFA